MYRVKDTLLIAHTVCGLEIT